MYKLRIRDAINWLKRHPGQRFSWCNNPRCLFGSIINDMPKFKGKRVEVHMLGKIVKPGSRKDKVVGTIPFHDAFWGGLWANGATVTTAQAIKRLEKISVAKIARTKSKRIAQ